MTPFRKKWTRSHISQENREKIFLLYYNYEGGGNSGLNDQK